MKGWQIYQMQQQAKQLRRLEELEAAKSGAPLRKPSWIERWILGVRDRRRR